MLTLEVLALRALTHPPLISLICETFSSTSESNDSMTDESTFMISVFSTLRLEYLTVNNLGPIKEISHPFIVIDDSDEPRITSVSTSEVMLVMVTLFNSILDKLDHIMLLVRVELKNDESDILTIDENVSRNVSNLLSRVP